MSSFLAPPPLFPEIGYLFPLCCILSNKTMLNNMFLLHVMMVPISFCDFRTLYLEYFELCIDPIYVRLGWYSSSHNNRSCTFLLLDLLLPFLYVSIRRFLFMFLSSIPPVSLLSFCVATKVFFFQIGRRETSAGFMYGFKISGEILRRMPLSHLLRAIELSVRPQKMIFRFPNVTVLYGKLTKVGILIDRFVTSFK